MKYIKLGNSDLEVSRICMGCMGFGDPGSGQHSWTLDEVHSREIIKRGLELGVNFFDTAIGYQSGTSEQYLGRALKDFAKRDEVVVATKFLPRTQEEIAEGITGQQHIEQMVDTSLKNLGMDHIDIYIYHMWDYETDIYDIMDGLDRVAELADKRGVSMTEISLAWLITRVTAPVAGATKLHHIEGAAKAVDLELSAEETAYLEEPYVPHRLVGVMAQNTSTASKEQHVWSTGDQKIQGR